MESWNFLTAPQKRTVALVVRTAHSFMDLVELAGPSRSELLHELEDLERERRKIDGFKDELPRCIKLVDEGML